VLKTLITKNKSTMRKQTIIIAAMAVCLAACEKVDLSEPQSGETAADVSEVSPSEKTKKFTFTLKGDFSDNWKPVTRAYLQADGRDLTDVWVLDYDAEGNLLQQLHQSDNTAEDFGKPVMQLKYGSHHVYFIASRGSGATLNTETKTITFSKVLDTFYKDYEVSVVSTSNGNRAVTLDRIVTRLRLFFTDAVAENAATINITPATWHYGFNYATGAAADTKTNYTTTINIPSTSIGSTTESANLYGFSPATEWTTDVVINSKTSSNTIIGQATIENAPFLPNRVTEYSGPLFSAGGTMTMSLNTTWNESVQGTW